MLSPFMLRKLCWLVGLTIFSPNTFWPSPIYIELYMCIYIYIHTNIFTHIYIYITKYLCIWDLNFIHPKMDTWDLTWRKSQHHDMAQIMAKIIQNLRRFCRDAEEPRFLRLFGSFTEAGRPWRAAQAATAAGGLSRTGFPQGETYW